MVVNIFYPIFTLKITILACLIQKKIGGPGHTRASPCTPGGLTAPPIPETAKKQCAHIFSGLYPDLFELCFFCIFNYYIG